MFASFAGSSTYFASSAVTSFAVDAASPASAEPEPAVDLTGAYVAYATVAIIAAVAVVGALIILMLRKRP